MFKSMAGTGHSVELIFTLHFSALPSSFGKMPHPIKWISFWLRVVVNDLALWPTKKQPVLSR
jgi:hypothetical protein